MHSTAAAWCKAHTSCAGLNTSGTHNLLTLEYEVLTLCSPFTCLRGYL